MSCTQKKAIDTMSSIILLLHVHIFCGGHHMILAMNGVKGTKEGQVSVPAVCQMV
jgi:hypothetical protein